MWNKIKDNWNLIATVLIICVVFFWGKSCGTKEFTPKEPKVIHITNYRDTIFPVDTFVKYEITPGKPKIIHDSFPVYYLDSSACNRYYEYNDTIIDSKYDIISKQVIQGRLSSSDIKVKLKVPLIIKDCTIVKRDSFIYRPSESEIHVGMIVGIKMIAPTLEMAVNKHTFMIGYDVINKQPMVGYKYRLFDWTPKKKK